jgi:hypothetical protein
MNADRSTTATTQITVTSIAEPTVAPFVNYFTANPPRISSGGSSELSWSVLNATSINIQPGIGEVEATGTALVSPTLRTTYTLTARNSKAWQTSTVVVWVE